MNDIVLKPVGRVISDVEKPVEMPLGGTKAIIEILPEYVDALKGIDENSHIWVLAWFHKAPRNVLKTVPGKLNPDLPEYGVFALRAFARPNPVALCLAKLVEVKDNHLYVEELDAVAGTPIIDIKPYFENDIVFSPVTPHIRGKSRDMRRKQFFKQALVHHQEKCTGLITGVRMALIAEEMFGHLNMADLFVEITGSACLADTIQGITRARIGNPARFIYELSDSMSETIWTKNAQTLSIKLKGNFSEDQIEELEDSELFDIERDF